MHIIKVIRQLDKYEALRRGSPHDAGVREKVAKKIPVFEKAIKKLLEKRATLEFQALDRLRSPNPKKENTMGFNSTMNDYSDLLAGRGKGGAANDSFKTGKNLHNDSDFASLNKMFDSVKTDTVSRLSDKQFLNELKLNELVNNSELVNEKLKELQEKYAALVDLN